MGQPSASSVHIDAALTNFSTAYVQSRSDFIANQVFPTIPVEHQTDKYYTFTKNDWFRDEAAKRAPATESAGSGYNVSNTTFSCDVYAFHKDLSDQMLANADAQVRAEANAARFVAQRMILKREIEFTSTFMTTSVWGTDVTGGSNFTQWSNYAASVPMEDIQDGKTTVLQNTGFEPNTLVLGYQVWAELINHPDFVDRIKHTSTDRVNQDLIAGLFGIERLLISKAIKATNVEGETAAYSFVHGKSAWLGYVAPDVGLEVPTAGATFVWRGATDGQAAMGADIATVQFEIPEKRVRRVEAQMAWDSKVIGSDLGYYLASVVA